MLRHRLSLLTLFFESAVGRIQYSDPSTRHTHSQEYQPVLWKSSLLSLPFVFCVAPAHLGASIVFDGQTGDGEKGEPCSSQACLGLLDAQRTQVEKGHSLLRGGTPGLVPFSIVSIPIYKQAKVMALCKILPLALHLE